MEKDRKQMLDCSLKIRSFCVMYVELSDTRTNVDPEIGQ